jgi:hypothetical protein
MKSQVCWWVQPLSPYFLSLGIKYVTYHLEKCLNWSDKYLEKQRFDLRFSQQWLQRTQSLLCNLETAWFFWRSQLSVEGMDGRSPGGDGQPSRTGPRAAHWAGACRVRMPIQPQREVPVMMAEDHQPQKHTEERLPSTGPWWAEHAAVKRKHLDVCNARLILWRIKTAWRPNRRDNYQSQYGVAAPFAIAATDVTGRPPQRRRCTCMLLKGSSVTWCLKVRIKKSKKCCRDVHC